MGYRVKPFTMSVRNNSTQEFVDVGLLGSDVDVEFQELQEDVSELQQDTDNLKDNTTKLLTLTPNTSVFATAVMHGKITVPEGFSCGGCCLDNNQEYLYVGVYKIVDDSEAYIAKIRYSDILSSSENDTITPVSTIQFNNTNSHMNGLCYYDNKIYVAAYRNDVGGTTYNNIDIVDLSTDEITVVSLPTSLTVSAVSVVVIDQTVNVIALHPDYTAYQVWQVANNVLMPVYQILPKVNGWYLVQDMHISEHAIYQLEGGRYVDGVKVGIDQIQVSTYDGRLSSFVYLSGTSVDDELEGITKIPGVDEFTLVSNRGIFYTVSTRLPLRDRNTFDINTYKRALNHTHQMFPSLSSTKTGVCEFRTNSLSKYYPYSFIIPVRKNLLIGYPIVFSVGPYFTNATNLGADIVAEISWNVAYMEYRLLLTYQGTNTSVGNYSGYTTYRLWEDATHLTVTDRNGTATHYIASNALNAIPTNISINGDFSCGIPAMIEYIAAESLLLNTN